MKLDRDYLVLHALVLLVLSGLSWAAPCSVEKASSEQVIVFLKNTKNDSSVASDCIVMAIHKLYRVRSKEAIDVLVMYLDFKQDSEGVVTGSNLEPYPAVSELFAIGKPALPSLIDVIKENASDVARNNAVKSIMLIYREDPPDGIRFLLNEAKRSQDIGEKGNLRQAANTGLRWCQGERRAACESVLSSE